MSYGPQNSGIAPQTVIYSQPYTPGRTFEKVCLLFIILGGCLIGVGMFINAAGDFTIYTSYETLRTLFAVGYIFEGIGTILLYLGIAFAIKAYFDRKNEDHIKK